MIRTVDLVVDAGCDGGGAESHGVFVDATGALLSGRRVLVVLRTGDQRVARRIRTGRCKAINVGLTRVTVMTSAEVVCVDGVGGVEAVVVRSTRTGRLCAVNTPAFLSCAGERTERVAMRPANRSPERSQRLPKVDDPIRSRDPGGHGMATS